LKFEISFFEYQAKMKALKLNTTNELCSVSLFRNVKNSADIKSKLLSGEIDATILNAALIPDVLQIFVAANIASLSNVQGTKSTKTIHTEVLYNLSPRKKVTESLKLFGIDESIKDLIVVLFQDESQEKFKSMQDIIDGDVTDLSELQEITDWNQISKIHGINENCDTGLISDLVISKTACKELLL